MASRLSSMADLFGLAALAGGVGAHGLPAPESDGDSAADTADEPAGIEADAATVRQLGLLGAPRCAGRRAFVLPPGVERRSAMHMALLRQHRGAVASRRREQEAKQDFQHLATVWNSLMIDHDSFLGDVGLSKPAGEQDRMPIEMIWSRPTCEVNGMWSGYTGAGFKTVLPSQAQAKIDQDHAWLCRGVPHRRG